MAFDTKYRPLLFSDVVGQESTVTILKNLLSSGHIYQKSYIFAGPSGTGKTTTARILARAMLCSNLIDNFEPCNTCSSCLEIIQGTSSFNFVEMDAANNSGVDTIRSIVEGLDFKTLGGKDRRIYLIDECFTEDTELITEQGFRSIKDLVEDRYSGKVLSYDPETKKPVWKIVTDWFDIEDRREVLKLYFDNGVELTVTLNQDIFTNNRGWVKACELTENDDICDTLISGLKSPADLGTRLLKTENLGKRKVYDITVQDTHSFFASSKEGKQTHAILVHNCHRLSRDAMDALLKPMEDCVPNSQDKRLVCLFCTTEPEKMRDTIKARCMTFGIKEPEKEEMIFRLRYICQKENLSFEDKALDTIFSVGKGHIRDMVNALERVSRVGDITFENTYSQLDLHTVTMSYRILKNLSQDLYTAMEDVKKSLRVVEPKTLYENLANAALSSYRQALGVTEGIGYFDLDLAKEVYDLYGDKVLFIVDRILNNNRKLDGNNIVAELLILSRYLTHEGIPQPVPLMSETPIRSLKQTVTIPDDEEEEKVYTEVIVDVQPETEQSTKELVERFNSEAKTLHGFAQNFVNQEGVAGNKVVDELDKSEVPVAVSRSEVKTLSASEVSDLRRKLIR
jgi:DNA polymerase III gamma/tau subunit